MSRNTSKRSRQLANLLLLALLAVAAGAAAYLFAVSDGVRQFRDSRSYREAAALSPLDAEFWVPAQSDRMSTSKAPLYPLFIAAMQDDLERIALAQLVIGALSWSLLAVGVYHSMPNLWGGLAGATVVLLFSLWPNIFGMYRSIMTESLAFSFLAGMTAASLLLISLRQLRWLFVLTGYAVLYATLRDGGALLVLLVAVAVLVPAAAVSAVKGELRRRSLSYVMAAAAMITAVGAAHFSAEYGERWRFPFYNVIALRIVPEANRLAWFEQHGMPVNAKLRERSGKGAGRDEWAFYREPDLSEFRKWAAQEGRTVYARWLLSDPYHLFLRPLADLPAVLSFEMDRVYGRVPKGYKSRASPVSGIGPVKYLVGALILVLLLRRWRNSGAVPRAMLVPLAMLALAAPYFLVLWHGDAMEVRRHCYPAGLQLQLAAVLVVALSFHSSREADESKRG